jgi:uncharacterized protein
LTIMYLMHAHFLFHPTLITFLPYYCRKGEFALDFDAGQTVKHLVESSGVPHTEVGLIQVEAQEKDFDYQVQQGDHVEIFPATAENTLPPPEWRFILDNHVGRLAAYLRMMGFDALYRNDYQDEELAQVAGAEKRILLTRDRHLLMRKMVEYGYCLRSMDSRHQLDEVTRRYRLGQFVHPFQRCLRCNAPLEAVSKEAVIDRLEPLTRRFYDEFHVCPVCSQLYWKGSHYEQMKAIIDHATHLV